MLRYFEGYDPADPKKKWPTDPGAAGPGPTLRAEIGDVVNITLLNQVKVQDFPGTLDSGEEGPSKRGKVSGANRGCGSVSSVGCTAGNVRCARSSASTAGDPANSGRWGYCLLMKAEYASGQ